MILNRAFTTATKAFYTIKEKEIYFIHRIRNLCPSFMNEPLVASDKATKFMYSVDVMPLRK